MNEHRRHEESHNPLGRIEEKLERLEDVVEITESVVADLGSKVVDLDSKIDQILGLLTQETFPATKGKILQLGEPGMAITGTKVGGTSSFQVVWNGGMTPGAAVTWTCPDDASIVITPDPSDTTGNTVTVVDGVGDASTAYTLNVAGTASDGTAVTATAKVPMLVTPATGGTINQLS